MTSLVAAGDCQENCPQVPVVAGAGGGDREEAGHTVTLDMRLELRPWHGPPCICSLTLSPHILAVTFLTSFSGSCNCCPEGQENLVPGPGSS